MPVQFKSLSEYSKQFGSSLTNDEMASGPYAGIESEKLALTVEPPLQHKKRLGGPQTSLSTNFFSVPSKESDYALLGQQDKFAQNVRYKPKPSFSKEKIYKNKENFDDAPPPSKQLKMQKRSKPIIKDTSVPDSVPIAPRVLSPPPAPREQKDALKDKNLEDVLGDSPPKAASVSNMNESVQTNMKKGIAVSAPEAPAEYSLKYKAGVAPLRPVKKFSEYQRQFQWTKGIKASPLLAAEEIIHHSNAELGPYKTEAIPKKSEYQLQFQKWKLPEYSAELALNLDRAPVAPVEKKKKAALKRSKSAGAALQEKTEEVEEAPAEEPSSTEILKEKLTSTHGKIKRQGTEYKANFKAPVKYDIINGAWKGAAPPQMIPQSADVDENNNNNNNNNKPVEEPLSNWFAEVLELRRRAKEYSKRAQGTHFSREHLVQLMAKQNECWDISSARSSTLSALNLETPAAGIISIKKPEEPAPEAPKQDDLDLEVEEVKEEIQPVEKKKGKSRVTRQSRKMAWLEEQKEKVAQQQKNLEEIQKQVAAEAEDDVSEAVAETDGEGRLPTPVLKSDPVPRHHLDLTTPSVGGALLTCPPSKSGHLIVTSRSGDSYVTMSDDMPEKSLEKKFDLDTLVTVPAGGKLTADTHALRDDTAESDRGLVTQYIVCPTLEEDKENKVQKKRKSKKPSNLSTVKEGQGKTFLSLDDVKASTGVNKQDDDVMSVSLMSVASSSSLASEVLERARKRQEFWNKKN